MKTSKLISLVGRSLVALAATGILAATAGACGQAVAGCGDVCPAGSDGACTSECGTYATCAGASPAAAADVQALFTCVANAGGTLDSLPTFCEPAHDQANAACAAGGAAQGDAG